MNLELCCECEQPTGNAGVMDGSLYAAHMGPFCEDCWGELPAILAEENEEQQSTIAQLRQRVEELEEFCRELMSTGNEWFEIEGSDLQALLLRYGLLKAYPVTEPCNDSYCWCASYDNIPGDCLRSTLPQQESSK